MADIEKRSYYELPEEPASLALKPQQVLLVRRRLPKVLVFQEPGTKPFSLVVTKRDIQQEGESFPNQSHQILFNKIRLFILKLGIFLTSEVPIVMTQRLIGVRDAAVSTLKKSPFEDLTPFFVRIREGQELPHLIRSLPTVISDYTLKELKVAGLREEAIEDPKSLLKIAVKSSDGIRITIIILSGEGRYSYFINYEGTEGDYDCS